IGLFSFCLFQLLLRAFYGMQDTRTPALINVFAVAINIVADIILFRYIKVEGLALGHATAYTFASIAAVVLVRRRLGGLEGALLALGANEVARIALAKIRASNAATAAAQAGANTFRVDRNVNLAKAAAEKAAEGVDSEARVTAFGIGAGGVATVTVERTADTI